MDSLKLGLGTLELVVLVLSVGSAVVARAAAREARAILRTLILDMERLQAENEGLLVRLRRVEGRQTARIGRDGDKKPDNGLPDPVRDPEGWRAAVRMIPLKARKDLQ